MHLVTLEILALSLGVTASSVAFNNQSSRNPYQPYPVSCPSGDLVRHADSINLEEQAYAQSRYSKASYALQQWLYQVWNSESVPGYGTQLPTLALALSGGGPKAGIITAGALYGLDDREDSQSVVAGLLQSMTYISALSGGSLTLSGVIANDFAKVSTLKKLFYDSSYQNLFAGVLAQVSTLQADTGNKTAAGYPTTILDAYARSTGFNFVGLPPSGGNNLLWSAVMEQQSFLQYDVPYPILTITNADVAAGMCVPGNGSVWEVSPFEFGSWDPRVGAFYPTQYIGTSTAQGPGNCTAGFDNIGFLTATSSNVLINATSCFTGSYKNSSMSFLADLFRDNFRANVTDNPYAIIPNPFYQSSVAGPIKNQTFIYGTDGGDNGQGIPLLPLLQKERDIQVVFVIDGDSSASNNNVTAGQWMYNTYLAAQVHGLDKMPIVPSSAQFLAQELYTRAQFYGCYDQDVATMIYFPNTNETKTMNTQNFFTPTEINSTFAGGAAMVSQSREVDWPACLACGIMHKTGTLLPEICTTCLETYCWMP